MSILCSFDTPQKKREEERVLEATSLLQQNLNHNLRDFKFIIYFFRCNNMLSYTENCYR